MGLHSGACDLSQTYIQWGVFGEELSRIGQELFPCLCCGEVVHLLSIPGCNLRVPGIQDKVLLEGHRTEVVGVSQGFLLVPVGVFLLQRKMYLFHFSIQTFGTWGYVLLRLTSGVISLWTDLFTSFFLLFFGCCSISFHVFLLLIHISSLVLPARVQERPCK